MKFNSKICLSLLVVSFSVLLACSGSSSGTFPSSVGEFKLVEGPIKQKEDPSVGLPAYHLGEYRSNDGTSVSHQVMPFATAELAEKEYSEKRDFLKMGAPDTTFTEKNGMLIQEKTGVRTTVYWRKDRTYFYTASKSRAAAEKLAELLMGK